MSPSTGKNQCDVCVDNTCMNLHQCSWTTRSFLPVGFLYINWVVCDSRFACEGTVEEKISTLQVKKKELAQNVLSGTGSTFTKLSLADLRIIFGVWDGRKLSNPWLAVQILSNMRLPKLFFLFSLMLWLMNGIKESVLSILRRGYLLKSNTFQVLLHVLWVDMIGLNKFQWCKLQFLMCILWKILLFNKNILSL